MKLISFNMNCATVGKVFSNCHITHQREMCKLCAKFFVAKVMQIYQYQFSPLFFPVIYADQLHAQLWLTKKRLKAFKCEHSLMENVLSKLIIFFKLSNFILWTSLYD